MAKQCPPMNRLFFVPRESAIRELVETYPPLSAAERRAQEKVRVYTGSIPLQFTFKGGRGEA